MSALATWLIVFATVNVMLGCCIHACSGSETTEPHERVIKSVVSYFLFVALVLGFGWILNVCQGVSW